MLLNFIFYLFILITIDAIYLKRVNASQREIPRKIRLKHIQRDIQNKLIMYVKYFKYFKKYFNKEQTIEFNLFSVTIR